MKTKSNLKKAASMILGAACFAAVLNACNEPGISPSTPANQVSARPVKDLSVAATECDVTNITANRTLDRDTIYILKGDVRVNNGATLTIEAGTIIKGDKDSRGTLTIERGAKIIANGSSTQPIVFTSSAAAGSRATQDWGGVNIFGNAPSNRPLNTNAEGYPVCVTAPTYGGGAVANDNSGVFRYVRIEYGGIPSSIPNSEKNGLTLYAVGTGTAIDHVQVSFGDDDAFEWFGGTVNAKYLVSYKNRDDDFDTDHGYSGAVQYGIVVRDPAIADISASNGFESDNNNDSPLFGGLPQTSAVFSNFTLIGPYDPAGLRTVVNNPSPGQRFQHGLQFRRNTGIDVYNTIVTGFPGRQFSIESNPASIALGSNTAVRTASVVASTCFFQGAGGTPWTGNVTNLCADATVVTGDPFDAAGMIAQSGLSDLAWDLVFPDLAPVSGAGVLTNGQDASLINPFFTSNATTPGDLTYFRGAFREQFLGDDNGWDLNAQWLEFDPQIQPYQ
jgi:hypothetical protein